MSRRLSLVVSCVLALSCGGGGGNGGSGYVPPINDGCFAKGTLIATSTGSVAIEDVVVGDRVQGFDFETEQVVDARVTEVFVHPAQPLGLLQTRAGLLRVTANHPVYDATTQSFVAAGERTEAFVALELVSNWSTTPSTLAGYRALEAAEIVYNLTVERVHNYFADGILVHNKPRCGYPGDPPDCQCLMSEPGCFQGPGTAGTSMGGGAGVGGASEAGAPSGAGWDQGGGAGGEPAAAGAGGEAP